MLDLPQRELDRWQLYWRDEPWGPRRDNIHAAMIIRELLRPHMAKGKEPPPLESYLLQSPQEAADRKAAEAAATALRMHAMAGIAERRKKRGKKK